MCVRDACMVGYMHVKKKIPIFPRKTLLFGYSFRCNSILQIGRLLFYLCTLFLMIAHHSKTSIALFTVFHHTRIFKRRNTKEYFLQKNSTKILTSFLLLQLNDTGKLIFLKRPLGEKRASQWSVKWKVLIFLLVRQLLSN